MTTKVMFRKFPEGDIIALFPYRQWNSAECVSYQHIRQHGGADLIGCINSTKPATPEEYKDLLHELKNYCTEDIKVIKRHSKRIAGEN